ncbi:ABC transporter ATP-binding protein [Paenibacillus sp. NEAU-GSW1]|uniref:ABC transporter ATP-binding protein n=1 Tax=Paenibacillus sp. NEAU-GSW1 TaxID=2682486 RepID=UPI0012E0CC53|nr:ABC transporter ATP-binding protein [Paenibacillus sp. NEAU-GSW1]MUT64746.1 ATP-binding cassette domain-containing protein [Paenibacillus sp. NEAU-GSW1]
MQTLIQANGLVKKYGSRTVVNGLDLDIQKGEVLGIIGPNGAGKSSTFDMILGLKKPDAGTVSYWCEDPARHIGVQLQSTPFFPGFTALENMRMFAAFYGLRLTDSGLRTHLQQCQLGEVGKTDAARLSGGQQKRLAIAMTLMHKPQLIFLDEPTAALDPRARREVRSLIQSLAESGVSVVFTSHDMEEVHKLATRIAFIRAGSIEAHGTADELLAKYDASSLEGLYIQLTESTL